MDVWLVFLLVSDMASIASVYLYRKNKRMMFGSVCIAVFLTLQIVRHL